MSGFKIDIPAEKSDAHIIRQLKEDNLPVVIFGAGELAEGFAKRFRAEGLEVWFTVSEGFDKSEGVYSPEEIDAKLPEYNLVLGFKRAITDSTGKYAPMYDLFRHKKRVALFRNFFEYAIENIPLEYFREHFDDYKSLYDLLADEKSRESYKTYLSVKLSEDYTRTSSLVETPTYFSGDFLHFGHDEVFVDCGAYDGDTIRDFNKYVICTMGGGGGSTHLSLTPLTGQNSKRM